MRRALTAWREGRLYKPQLYPSATSLCQVVGVRTSAAAASPASPPAVASAPPASLSRAAPHATSPVHSARSPREETGCRQPPPTAAAAGRVHTMLLVPLPCSPPCSVAQRELQTVRVAEGGSSIPACEQAIRSSSRSKLRCLPDSHHRPVRWETRACGPGPLPPPVLPPACPQTGEQENTAVYRRLATQKQRRRERAHDIDPLL
jgi:hypothetical protein